MLRSLCFMQGVPEITSSQHALSIPTMWILFIRIPEREWRELSGDSPAWAGVAECTLKSQFKEPDSFRRSRTTIFNTHQLHVKTGLVQRTLTWQQGGHWQTGDAAEGTHLPSSRGLWSTLPSSHHFQTPESSSQPSLSALLAQSPSKSHRVYGRAGWGPVLWAPRSTVTLTFQPSTDITLGTSPTRLSSLVLGLYLTHL